jgi:hypothetical protein
VALAGEGEDGAVVDEAVDDGARGHLVWEHLIAVGTTVTGRPRTDPSVQYSRTRLLHWVVNGKPIFGPGMENARHGQPSFGNRRHRAPRRVCVLAAP